MKRLVFIIIILLSTFISLSLYAEDEQSDPFRFKVRVLGGLGLGSNDGLAGGNTTSKGSTDLQVQVFFFEAPINNKASITQRYQQQPKNKNDATFSFGLNLGYIHTLTTEDGPVNYFQILALYDYRFIDLIIFQFAFGVAAPENTGPTVFNFNFGLGLDIPISQDFAIPILVRYDLFHNLKTKANAKTIHRIGLLTGLTMKF